MAIYPSLIAASQKDLTEKLSLVRTLPGRPCVHLDVMDGTFVKQKTLSPEKFSLADGPPFQLHLMVREPEKIVSKALALKPRGIFIHFETTKKLDELLLQIRNSKIQAGVALNPETPVVSLKPFLKNIDAVLLMSVHPGRYGAKFLPGVYARVRALRQLAPKLRIIVDGGVSLGNIVKLRVAGADDFVVGSRIMLAKDPQKAYKQFLSKLKQS